MGKAKGQRRFDNRLKMRLSHIALNDRTPAMKKQIANFVDFMAHSGESYKIPKRHPFKRVK